MSRRRAVAVVGGGPAGLMAAEVIATAGHAVTVYDRMPSLGRKLLMAGRGGLNLTHSEPLEAFLGRYTPAEGPIVEAVRAYPPEAVRAWCEALGQPTFVGSSGRIFPKAMKASPLLRAWLQRLSSAGVEVRTRHRWTDFGPEGKLYFDTPQESVEVRSDAVILALGGASSLSRAAGSRAARSMRLVRRSGVRSPRTGARGSRSTSSPT